MVIPPLSDEILDAILAGPAREEYCVFLETTKITGQERYSYIFTKPVDLLLCTAADSPALFFRKAQGFLDSGFYLAGWFSYEFGYLMEPALKRQFMPDASATLAELGVFRKPQVFDHLRGDFTAVPSRPFSPPPRRSGFPAYSIEALRPNQTREDYLERIAVIKSYIEAGDTYQVNYTLKLLFNFSGSPEALYKVLRNNQRVSYGAFIKSGKRRIMSFSPELFFRKQGAACIVRPMKGTVRRGCTAREDRELRGFLNKDPKNRSENIMIVDLLRNDLGRLAGMGAVKVESLFDIETYDTLHQMTSTIRGELKAGTSLYDMFAALFPCGSVTGAPKIRTMEIIHELEAAERGVYTGAVGYIAPDGDAVFCVPIRTVVLEEGRGEMGIGSGIIYDSDPADEWRECLLKGRFLTEPRPDFQLIETILWQPDDGFWLLDLHLERLAASADYFGYPLRVEQVIGILEQAAQGFAADISCRVRLLLYKDGTIEIDAEKCGIRPLSLLPEAPISNADLPRVIFAEKSTCSQSPFLYHKTTMRELYNEEREMAVGKGFYEVLFTNENDEVTEGGVTNIFMRKGRDFFTPPITCGLLDGVFRRFLIQQNPGRIMERVLNRKDLRDADALYVGNSVRGLVQVTLG